MLLVPMSCDINQTVKPVRLFGHLPISSTPQRKVCFFLLQAPVKGILLCCKDKKQYEEWLNNPKDDKFQHTDMYFIPFSKKDPNTPSFSKAISIYGRKYAYTEQDAWNGYYQDVLKALTTANSHVTKVLDEFFTKEHS